MSDDCQHCGADLDDLVDLEGLQSDLEELEATDPIVKAAAISYANMVARVTGAQPDAELSEHEKLTRALDAAQDEIEKSIETRETLREQRDRLIALIEEQPHELSEGDSWYRDALVAKAHAITGCHHRSPWR